MTATRLPEFSEHEVLASLCRNSFADFVKEFWDVVVPERLRWNWHMGYLCDVMQRVAERVFAGRPKKHDLIINISPGTSKSSIVSIMFPAWVWTRLTSARVLSGSYSHTLAVDLSRKSRDLIKSDLYKACFTDIEISESQDAKGFFVNRHGGERYAFGIGGTVTGKHGHFIIVDDPLNPNQAVSEAELRNANRWMEETLPSRAVDRSVVPTILIMQRLHENDPTADRLRKAAKVPVKHVCIPAELTEHVSPPSLRRHYVGGLMDPTRLPRSVLNEAMAQGTYAYSAQYLQTPVPRGGAMFHTDELKFGKPPAVFRHVVRGWDKAATQDGGMYTAGVKVGIDEHKRVWVLDVVRGQWDAYRREAKIVETAGRDGRRVKVGVEQEPGSGGKESAEATARRLMGYAVRLVRVGKGDGDKEARADPFAAQVNAGNVWLAEAPWNNDYVNELRFFPRSRYKDQVDATSLAFNMLARPAIVAGGGKAAIAKMRGNAYTPRVDMRQVRRRRRELEKLMK